MLNFLRFKKNKVSATLQCFIIVGGFVAVFFTPWNDNAIVEEYVFIENFLVEDFEAIQITIPHSEEPLFEANVPPAIQIPFTEVDLTLHTHVEIDVFEDRMGTVASRSIPARQVLNIDLIFDNNGMGRITSDEDIEEWVNVENLHENPLPPIPVTPRVTPQATALNVDVGSNRALGQQMAAERGWIGEQWYALERLWTRESNWNHLAANPRSSARGIPQKMASIHFGQDWATSEVFAAWMNDPRAQIEWGLNYIENRYGNPVAAWEFFLRHGWY